ncbi:MAG: inositol monophosphatase [Archangiaceae bacterium]|nr:inositol monophosphatase [Archangiaceae bacterium]
MDLDVRFGAAIAIAEEAAQLALRHFENRGALTVEHKGLQDLVSAADREVEQLVRTRIAERFPEDALLGEEAGSGGAVSSRALWVIDPIDGTTNFLRGLPHWGVVLAFVADEVVEHGVIVAPVLRERYVARKGRGAFCNDRPLKVTGTAKLSEAVIGFGSNKKTPHQPYLAALDQLLAEGIEYRRLGCASMNLAAVASGKLDGFYEAKLSPWDALAGMLLVHEAGGRCNDYLADDGLLRGNSVLVGNRPLYDSLAAAFKVFSEA